MCSPNDRKRGSSENGNCSNGPASSTTVSVAMLPAVAKADEETELKYLMTHGKSGEILNQSSGKEVSLSSVKQVVEPEIVVQEKNFTKR